MKKLIIVALSIVIFSCHSQEKDRLSNNLQEAIIKKIEIPINPKTMETHTTERFDIENYLKNRSKEEGMYLFVRDDGAKVLETDINGYSFFRYVTPKDSLFTIEKEYYKNGLLKEKRETYVTGGFIKGIRYEYDEQGKLIKVEDWDKPFKFNWEQIKKYCEKDLKLDLIKDKVKIVNYLEYPNYNFPTWSISYLGKYKDKQGLIRIMLDGRTGDLLHIECQLGKGGEGTVFEVLYDGIAENKKKEKEDNTYFTTYKGKDYTKKEWKEYQEEWYNDYLENKNKSFWDDVFPGRKKK